MATASGGRAGTQSSSLSFRSCKTACCIRPEHKSDAIPAVPRRAKRPRCMAPLILLFLFRDHRIGVES